MKQQLHLFLATLFIVSTLVTSLHELLPHPEQSLQIDLQQVSFKTPTKLTNQITAQTISTLGSRAPPSFS